MQKNHPSTNYLPISPTTTMGKSYAEEEDRTIKALGAYHSGQNRNLCIIARIWRILPSPTPQVSWEAIQNWQPKSPTPTY
jgi:hypothetical protein